MCQRESWGNTYCGKDGKIPPQWFGHVQRRPVEAPIKRVDQVEDSSIDGYRQRPRKIIGETIKRD